LRFHEIVIQTDAQYGHSQSEKKLGLGDKYHRSIKVQTLEAQNQHQLKSPLSDLFYDVIFKKEKFSKNFGLLRNFFLLYNP
jgi:hypothetical protein